MQPIRSRLAAIAASFVLAALTSWGVREITPEARVALESWMNHTFELVLLLGYAVVHPWLQKRSNPTGAFSVEAAKKLEAVADVKRQTT